MVYNIVSLETPLPQIAIEVAKDPLTTEIIDHAVWAAEAAEHIGISLTPQEVGVHFGLEEASKRYRFGEALKRLVPSNLQERNWLLPIGEKIERVGRIAVAMAETPSPTERFKQDKPFWECMNVENAWEAHAFERKHFARTELDLTTPKQLPEMDWLRVADGETFTSLQKIQSETRGLRFHQLIKTPPAVLDSVNKIAEGTQKTFVHTWLPRYLHEGQEPIMSDEERQHYDYDSELGTVAMFRSKALRIEADNALSEEEQKVVTKANELLSEGLAGEYLLQRVLHDHAARESEGLRKMLPMLVALSGAAWGVQNYAPNDLIRGFAKIAGSGDDIATEAMSLPRLKLSKEKLHARLRWFIPLALGMMAADAGVDKIDNSVNSHIGGAIYGITTVGLSAASSIASLKEHSSRYRELVAEGKVPEEHLTKSGKAAREHYIYHDSLRKGIVAGTIAGPAISAALWPYVSDKPYIYVPLGAIEPIAAAISVKYDEKRLPHRLKKYTREQTAALQAGR